MRVGFAAILLAVLSYGVPAIAADETGSARAHYQRATSHFAIGEFDDAAREYELAYKLHPDPALLFDAAQAHRLAGHHQKALLLYRSYLRLYPTGASVSSCRDQVTRLSAVVAADEKAKSSPPTGTQEPEPPVTEARPPEPATTEAKPTPPPPPPPIVVAKPTPEQKPLYKKWWLWTAVGGAVVAAAVVTVAVLETRPAGNSFSNVPDIGPRASTLVKISWGAGR